MNKATNLLVLAILGACYVIVLRQVMDSVVGLTGELIEPIHKMALTGSAATLSSLVLHVINRFVLIKKAIHLSMAMAIMAFSWFYIYRPITDGVSFLPELFLYGYSAFAFMMFLGAPFVIGFALNKHGQ